VSFAVEFSTRPQWPATWAGCKQAKPSVASSEEGPPTAFHLLVEGGAKLYWLHLAVAPDAPLSSLDTFLRQIWLECCGHMSAFSIGNARYSGHPMNEMGDKSTRVPAGKILSVGEKFSYEYDFGTTTELALKVVGMRQTEAKRQAVQLLARNAPPPIHCDECGPETLATQVCTQCLWNGSGWVCEDCAETHECGEEMLLPVVNSPRVGMCGYTG
jgi:hypothetical protein